MITSETTHDRCPSCGTELPPGARDGMCQPCLLRLALTCGDEDASDLECEDEDDASDPSRPPETQSGALPRAPGRFGDYELLEQIGRGATGLVFKARQRSLDRLVALKVLHLDEHAPPDAVRRFRTEASAAAGLRHPGIVTIHEVGVYHGRHYLAMDLIDGPNLARLVADRPLRADRAARMVAAVSEGIQYAHEHGILHRDLKPSNILVDSSDQPHVADFGLAKRMHADAGMTMTIPGQVMGSPNYMSPEQARGAKVGPASDVHALGAVLYHCLSGRPPFLGQSVPDTLHEVIYAEPLKLRLLVAGIPRDLETIALKCLEKDPAQRYRDARSLAEDLRRFLNREPIRARPVSRVERAWRWCRRRPAIATLSAATAVLVLAVSIGSPIAALRIRGERERAEDNLYAADLNLAQQALSQSSLARARALLERHRPAPHHIDRRGFEWRYLWGRTGSDDRTLIQAPEGERHLVAIADGNLIAAGNNVWDASSQQLARTLPDGVVAIIHSPQDNALLTGGYDGLVSWDLATWQPTTLLADEDVRVVALSPDSRWMATGGDQLRLWERSGRTWRCIATRPRVFKVWHNCHTLDFSPDGRILASGTGETWSNRCTMELWSTPSLELQPGLPDTPGDVGCLAFSPDGSRLVVGCWNGRVRMWDFHTRTEVETAMRHHGFITDLVFSPDDPDVFATTASDRTVRLWNLRTNAELVTMQGPADQPWAMTFANDGRTILTLEQNGRIAAWDASVRRLEDVLIAQGPRTMPLGFSDNGATLATIDETGRLRFWRVHERDEIEARATTLDLTGMFTRDFEVIAPVLSHDQTTLALGMLDGGVKLWHLPTGTPRVLNAHLQQVRNVAFSPDDRTLATVANDGIVKLWDVASGTLRAGSPVSAPLAGEDFNVPLVWSPDARMLAVAGERTVHLYDGGNCRLLRTLDAGGVIYSLRFAPDGAELVSAQGDFHLTFWDHRSGRPLARVPSSHQEGAYDLCFSPDSRTMATVVDHVKLWSVVTRQEVATLRGHERTIFATLFSPDGNLLVTADYAGCVRLWPAPSFEQIDGGGR